MEWWYSRWASDVSIVRRRGGKFKEQKWISNRNINIFTRGDGSEWKMMKKNKCIVRMNNRGRWKGHFQGNFHDYSTQWHPSQTPLRRHRAQPTRTNYRQITSRAVCRLAFRDRKTNSNLKALQNWINKTLHVKTVTMVHHMQREAPAKFDIQISCTGASSGTSHTWYMAPHSAKNAGLPMPMNYFPASHCVQRHFLLRHQSNASLISWFTSIQSLQPC